MTLQPLLAKSLRDPNSPPRPEETLEFTQFCVSRIFCLWSIMMISRLSENVTG